MIFEDCYRLDVTETYRLGLLSQRSDLLQAGPSVSRIPVGAKFSAPVQTGRGAHTTSCTMGAGSISRW